MDGFQRVESKFAPIPDGTYTMYMTEATFIISSNKGTPGINFKVKIDEVTEEGTVQPNASKSFYMTDYITEKSVTTLCGHLDMMGFKVNDKGYYLMPDGSLMPDFLKMTDKETISFLVGLPFVGKLKGSENNYEGKDNQGNTVEKEGYQYNVNPNYVVPPEGGRKVIQQSKHPSKAAAFALAGTADGAGAVPDAAAAAAAFGAQPVMAGVAPTPGRPAF